MATPYEQLSMEQVGNYDEEGLRRLIQARLAQAPRQMPVAAPQPAPQPAPQRALPLAMDSMQATMPRSLRLRQQIAELEGQGAGDDGGMSLLNALAAGYAGEQYAPVQAHFLKRAMAMSPENRTKAQIARLSREAEIADRQEGAAALQRERIEEQQRRDRERADERERQRAWQQNFQEQGQQQLQAYREALLGLRTPQAPPSQENQPALQPNIIKPGIAPETAMGIRGKWENFWNKVGDAVNAGDPQDASRQASEQLSALANSTRTILQDAVPGRPSNYLVQLFNAQTIEPNQLFVGKGTAINRISAVQGILDNGIQAQSSILQNPAAYTKSHVSNAAIKLQQLKQLKAEYNALGSVLSGSQDRTRLEELRAKYGSRKP